ncbi:MAG: hypothetical protein U0325_36305 [Polyangiales bacterium]
MNLGAMQPLGASSMTAPGFSHARYTVRRSFWSFLGRRFYVDAPDGSLVAFVKHPLLKLRGEFTIFADEGETRPLVVVRNRAVLSLNMAHDVFDAQTQQRLGSIRSRGLKSMIRDTWDLLDDADQPVGLMQEDGMSLVRRFVPILPSHHHIELGGQVVARIDQVFRFFTKEFTLDLSMAPGRLDPRFAVACAMLALMAETAREAQG